MGRGTQKSTFAVVATSCGTVHWWLLWETMDISSHQQQTLLKAPHDVENSVPRGSEARTVDGAHIGIMGPVSEDSADARRRDRK